MPELSQFTDAQLRAMPFAGIRKLRELFIGIDGMSQIPQTQTVPLVHKDTGKITREWIPYLQRAVNAASTTDIATLQATIEEMQTTIATLQALVDALEAGLDHQQVLARGLRA